MTQIASRLTSTVRTIPNIINFHSSRFATTISFPMIRNSPDVYTLLFKRAINATDWELNTPCGIHAQRKITKEVLALKPEEQPFSHLFSKKPWNIEAFEEARLPVAISRLAEPELFSSRPGKQYFLFMDMPIYMPGRGWEVPDELSQFRESIVKAAEFEKLVNPHVHDYYVYLTIDQRPVAPGLSQRRTGWHADSFINKETRLEPRNPDYKKEIETDSVYLVYSCIPTEFCPGPFPFTGIDPDNTERVLSHFESMSKNKEVKTYPPFTLLRMGPDVVHRVGINKADTTLFRTFLKITFSRQILNREGNGHNALFDYNWPMIPRKDDKRNHSTLLAGYGREDLDLFHPISSHELVKSFTQKAPWSEGVLYTVRKHAAVTAYLAAPGELLQTALDGFTTTVNTARSGDWKVTAPSGDQYFLTAKKLEELYTPDPSGRTFTPKQIEAKAIRILKPIQFVAPWGSTQFLPEGAYLIQGRSGDPYGILEKDFEQNYTRQELQRLS